MQFDVFRNVNVDTKRQFPYLLDIQANLLSELATRVVVPLMYRNYFGKTAKTLNPIFIIENKEVVMVTSELAGVSIKALGEKVKSLIESRYDIMNALDLL